VIGAYLSPDAKLGALVELNCETDFVARNDSFLAYAQVLAELVATKNPADIAALVAYPGVEEQRQALVQKIGENISIRRFSQMQVRPDSAAKLAQYVHGGRIGVLVEYEGSDEAGKDVAMHISFARPAYLAKGEISAELVAREREILMARARESGKSPEIAAKMVEGGLNKYLAEMTLLGQPFVKDDKQSVEKMLTAKKTKVLGYRFLVVGEGIERKSSDFAAEVMAMAKK
jgi:elongation factor Ts